MQFSLAALISLSILQGACAAPAPTTTPVEMSEQGEPSGTLERRFFGGYGGFGLGGYGGFGYPYYGSSFMSGSSAGQSSSFNSNSMTSAGPFGYASSKNQAASSSSYSNNYGGFFAKDAEAKKPTTGTLAKRFFGGYGYGGLGGYGSLGLGGYGGLGLGGYGGFGYPYGGSFMSGSSAGQSSSYNSNSMTSAGPFGYASSNNQAASSSSYSNNYGGFFTKDAEAKKPTNES